MSCVCKVLHSELSVNREGTFIRVPFILRSPTAPRVVSR